jgi:hypothetical protein
MAKTTLKYEPTGQRPGGKPKKWCKEDLENSTNIKLPKP